MKRIKVVFNNYLEKRKLKRANSKKDKENYRMEQAEIDTKHTDIDLLEVTWFILAVLRNSEVFALNQCKKVSEAYRIITEVYKQFSQFELSRKHNWILTTDRLYHIKDKETHINYLENTWISLAGLRHFKTFTLAQREKINEAYQIVSEVYKEFDQSKFWGEYFEEMK